MIASDSRSRNVGKHLFIPFPFLNFRNALFPFPSRSRTLGMGFFHSLPVPEFWEWFFSFLSRSRTSELELSILVPVPELPKVIPAHPCNPFLFSLERKSFPLGLVWIETYFFFKLFSILVKNPSNISLYQTESVF